MRALNAAIQPLASSIVAPGSRLIWSLIRPIHARAMRAHALISIIAMLVLCSGFAQESIRPDSREWRELFDPPFAQPSEIPTTSPLRNQLFELLRSPIARLAKRPVRFEGTLRAFKNWAFFTGSTVDDSGAAVRFPPVDNSDTVALWLRTSDGWHLVDYKAGHSDVFYAVWPQQYGLPRELLGLR